MLRIARLAAAVVALGACSSSNNHPDAAPADGAGGAGGADADAAPADATPAYLIPTSVTVPVASAPPSTKLPADTFVACIDSSSATTFSSNCRVVEWGNWTYWVLTYNDSRLQQLITPFDASGKRAPGPRWPLITAGVRYVESIQVDDAAQTVTFLGQGGNTTSVTWTDLRIDQTLPPPPDGGVYGSLYPNPTAVQVARGYLPASQPAGISPNASCPMSATDSTQGINCWVVRWGRWTYWAFSYLDNRTSLLITPYDETGAFLDSAPWPQEKTGTRYLWMTAVDATAQTVTFRGQLDPTATQMVTMTWDELRIDQP